MNAPTSCPHCGADTVSAHHFTDAGATDPATAEVLGYCPMLAAQRNRSPYLPAPTEQRHPFLWTAADARIAARTDEALAR